MSGTREAGGHAGWYDRNCSADGRRTQRSARRHRPRQRWSPSCSTFCSKGLELAANVSANPLAEGPSRSAKEKSGGKNLKEQDASRVVGGGGQISTKNRRH